MTDRPNEVNGVFEALGDATRRRLLELLVPGEQSVGTLVESLQAGASISQPAVSQHLKVLRNAGLVTVRAVGTRRLYALDDAGLVVAQTWLARLTDPLLPFEQPLDALATEVARGRRAGRTSSTASPNDSGGASEMPAQAG